MTTQLEQQLQAYGEMIDDAISDHHGGSPAAPPPRRRRGLVLVAALLVAGGVAAVFAGTSLAGRDQAWAGWSAAAQTTDPEAAEAFDDACRDQLGEWGSLPALAFDLRGEGGSVVYGDDQGWATCQARRSGEGAMQVTATQVSPRGDLAVARQTLAGDRDVVLVSVGWRGEPAASMAWGVVSPDVSGLTIATDRGDVEASITGETWVAWWPRDDAEHATVTAVDSSGAALVAAPIGEFAPPAPDSGTLAEGGTPLEREILADGVVTFAELSRALDAWQACVADAGHELEIRIDTATGTYEAVGPIVELPAPEALTGEELRQLDLEAERLLRPSGVAIEACRAEHVSRIEQIYSQQIYSQQDTGS